MAGSGGVHRRWSRRQVLGGAAAVGGLLGTEALLGRAASGAARGAITAKMAPSGARGLGPGGRLLAPTTRPYPHAAAGSDMMPDIENIVVLMMENHSFDDHLGMLGRGDGLTLGPDGKPVNYNPTTTGEFARSYPLPNTQTPATSTISQSWTKSHQCWDNGTNMGFAKYCGPASMGYCTAELFPFYYSMAKQFPIGDRYFCSVMAQTYPNRRFLIAGTALGDVATNATGISSKTPPNGTIFDRLNHYGISWKDYYPDLPTAALFIPNWTTNPSHMAHINTFFDDAASGSLPQFSLVDPYATLSEEHGTMSIGEAYAARVMEAVMSSPQWPHIAMFWVYDEHGGWYDHVPPQPAVRPDTVAPEIASTQFQGTYDYTGFRTPCAVLSPYAKADYVSHVVHTHTSLLKFVETKWNLPAMTYRDANASNMLDFFSFKTRPHFAEPPKVAKPLNPFPPGPIPTGSGKSTLSKFHFVATPVNAHTLPPASYVSKAPPKGASKLIAAHTKQALAKP